MKLAVSKKEITVLGKDLNVPWKIEGVSFQASIPWALATILPIAAFALFFPPALYLVGFLGIVITTHEAGHYLVARMSGIRPTEFFWGFGPEVFAIQTKNCRYGLKFISAGGYVKLEGMTSQSELPKDIAEEDTFRAASPFGRLMTILAGPFVNFGVAIVAFASAGVVAGVSILDSVKGGLDSFWLLITLTVEQFGILAGSPLGYASDVVTNPEAVEVQFAGPLTLLDISNQAVGAGISQSLIWLGIISAAVGLVNLLPFPPLDGSHAVAAIFDGVTRMVTKNKNYMFNIHKLTPLAYATVIVLAFITLSSFIVELQVPSVDFFGSS